MMRLSLALLIITIVSTTQSACPSECNNWIKFGNLEGKLSLGPYSVLSYTATANPQDGLQSVEGAISLNAATSINYLVNTTHPTFEFSNKTSNNEVSAYGSLSMVPSDEIPQLNVNINLTTAVDNQFQSGGVNFSLLFDTNFPSSENRQTYDNVQYQWTVCCTDDNLTNATAWVWINPSGFGFFPSSAVFLSLENSDKYVSVSSNNSQPSVNVHFKLTPVSLIQDSTICTSGNCGRHTSFLYMINDE